MNAEKYVVRLSVDGKRQDQIWDTSSPLGIGHPFRWILEKTPGGSVRIVHLQKGAHLHPVMQLVPGEKAELTKRSSILDRNLTVELIPARPIEPAYLPQDASQLRKQTAAPGSILRTFAFAGLKRTVLNCQAIHTAYVAHARNRPIFVVYRKPEGYRVEALLPGVYLKPKGKKALEAKPGEGWDLSNEAFLTCTIVRNRYWWRFNAIQVPDTMGSEPVEKHAVPSSDPDLAWLKRSTLLVLGILALSWVVLWRVPQKTAPEPQAPPTVIKLKPIAKPIVKPTPPASAKKAAPKLAGSSGGGLQKAEKTERASLGSAQGLPDKPSAKPAPRKASQMHPAAPRDMARTGAPKLQTGNAAQKPSAALSQTRALRDALLGSRVLSDKGKLPAVAQKIGKTTEGGGDMFTSNGDGPALGNTNVAPIYSAGNAKVTGIGSPDGIPDGKNRRGGYASGTQAAPGGEGGSSFVAVDSGGSLVDEGLSKEEVGAVIQAHMSEIRYCHESALLSNPNAVGQLVVQFKIGPQGNVITAMEQSSSLPSQSLPACVISHLKTWKFPKPKGGVTVSVSYPFIFKALGRS